MFIMYYIKCRNHSANSYFYNHEFYSLLILNNHNLQLYVFVLNLKQWDIIINFCLLKPNSTCGMRKPAVGPKNLLLFTRLIFFIKWGDLEWEGHNLIASFCDESNLWYFWICFNGENHPVFPCFMHFYFFFVVRYIWFLFLFLSIILAMTLFLHMCFFLE